MQQLIITDAMKFGIKDVTRRKLKYSKKYKAGADKITDQILEDYDLRRKRIFSGSEKKYMIDNFDKDYLQLYYEKFIIYLGTVSRYLMNQKLHEIPYCG